MAATYAIHVFHGASPTPQIVATNARFHRADTSPTTDAGTVGIPLPSVGYAYSWRKSLKLCIVTTPTGTASNIRFYTDGSPWGTGITLLVSTNSTYIQASNYDNDNAVVGGTDATTYTSLNPLIVNAGTVLSNPNTGYGIQDYTVLQVRGSTAVVFGTTAPRTIGFRVDET